jgi:HSP20 family protein
MATSLAPFNTRFGIFDDFRREIDSVFNRFFENGTEIGEQTTWSPRLNLSETDTQYEVSLDLPGVELKDIDVELQHGDLWISGERFKESEEKGKRFQRVERFYGQFRRMIRLGDDVDAKHVDAQYKDGVLRITVPKTEESKAKRIEVKS